MKLDKFDKKTIDDLLTNVKSSGLVSKQDVLSVEEKVEGAISSNININSFTAIPSSTNVSELVSSLECLMAEQEVEPDITIDALLVKVETLKRKVKQKMNNINDVSELDTELVDNVLNNHFLSRYYGEEGNKTLEDITDKNMQDITDEIMYIVDCLGRDKPSGLRSSALEAVHEIEKALYGKPKNAFAILRMTLNNALTVHMHESEISEVTVRDFIKEFIVNNRMQSILKDLHSEITKLQTSLLFDDKYDNNMNNNETVFTYGYLDKKVDNLNYLLDDNISFYMINVFGRLLGK